MQLPQKPAVVRPSPNKAPEFQEPRKAAPGTKRPNTREQREILRANEFQCQSCKVKLDDPTDASDTKHPVGSVPIFIDIPGREKLLPEQRTAVYCPCCALNRSPDHLYQNLLSKNLYVFHWKEHDNGVPRHEDLIPGIRHAYARIAQIAQQLGNAHTIGDPMVPVMKAIFEQGYPFEPIWNAPHYIREMIQAERTNHHGMPPLPNTGNLLNYHHPDPDHEAWLTTNWAMIIQRNPAMWASMRQELFLFPKPIITLTNQYDTDKVRKAINDRLNEDPERKQALIQSYGEEDFEEA
jgi:hypothetical protein